MIFSLNLGQGSRNMGKKTKQNGRSPDSNPQQWVDEQLKSAKY